MSVAGEYHTLCRYRAWGRRRQAGTEIWGSSETLSQECSTTRDVSTTGLLAVVSVQIVLTRGILAASDSGDRGFRPCAMSVGVPYAAM
eukprot:3159118-Rhodomonas_salina.1